LSRSAGSGSNRNAAKVGAGISIRGPDHPGRSNKTMTHAGNPQREHIISQALEARTRTEIDEAAEALHRWIDQHPDDASAVYALEPLALRFEALSSPAGDRKRAVARR